MKCLLTLLLSLSITVILGCSVLSTQVEVKEDHFRFENFIRNIKFEKEYIYLACHRQRPIGWDNPRQYVAGEQNLWITAAFDDSNTMKLLKTAHFNFKVNLESGKSYMPNREINGDRISVWIQEVDSGARVSEVQEANLEIQLSEYVKSRKQCTTSTV